MLTRWGANVGTSDIRTLLKAFARLTSQPDNENFIFSGLISKISMWSLSIGTKGYYEWKYYLIVHLDNWQIFEFAKALFKIKYKLKFKYTNFTIFEGLFFSRSLNSFPVFVTGARFLCCSRCVADEYCYLIKSPASLQLRSRICC